VSVTPAFNTSPSPSKEGLYEATVAEVTSKRSRIAQMQASTSPVLRGPLGRELVGWVYRLRVENVEV